MDAGQHMKEYDENTGQPWPPVARPIDEALFHACATASLGEIRRLLNQGADPNAPHYGPEATIPEVDAGYCIQQAACNPDIAVFDLLVEHGADPKQTNIWGQQPLAFAVSENSLEMVKHLVALGNNPTARDLDGGSVLSHAALNPDPQVLEYLIAHGAEPNTGDQNELGRALQEGTPERVRFFLSHGWRPKDLDPMFFRGAPLENIRIVLEAGFDPNTIDGEVLDGEEPTGNPHPMVEDLDPERRALFEEYGATPGKVNLTDWYTLFAKGTFGEFLAAVERKPVADWNGRLCYCFDSALHTVILHREDEKPMPFVRYLVEHGADVNLPCDDGIAPIHVAAMLPDPECVLYLLRHGAFVNQPDHDALPWRPIHHAAWQGVPEVVQALVRHGAFADCTNVYGDTPQGIIAREIGREDIVAMLDEGLPAPPVEPSEERPPVLYLLMGIPASGKTTFCQRVLADPALDIVSQDVSGTHAREWAAFEAALAKRRSVAVDDTNVEKERRGRFLGAAKAAGCRTVGLFFQSVLADCLARNEARDVQSRIKRLAVLGKSARLELPTRDEGFDKLFFVRIVDGLFEIEPWEET